MLGEEEGEICNGQKGLRCGAEAAWCPWHLHVQLSAKSIFIVAPVRRSVRPEVPIAKVPCGEEERDATAAQLCREPWDPSSSPPPSQPARKQKQVYPTA